MCIHACRPVHTSGGMAEVPVLASPGAVPPLGGPPEVRNASSAPRQHPARRERPFDPMALRADASSATNTPCDPRYPAARPVEISRLTGAARL